MTSNHWQIGFVAIGCKLHTICQPTFQIVHEMISSGRVSRSNVPAGDKLRFRFQSRPRPNVAPTLALVLKGRVLFLVPAKLPYPWWRVRAMTCPLIRCRVFGMSTAKVSPSLLNSTLVSICACQ